MKYDAMYFLEKFDAIPDILWTIRNYKNSYGQCCALGHCGAAFKHGLSPEAQALSYLFVKNLKTNPIIINDGVNDTSNTSALSDEYLLDLGNSPKERIMNALYLINAGVTLD